MLRRFVALTALTGLLLCVHGSAVADNSTVERQVSAETRAARKEFKAGAKQALRTLNSASSTLSLELRGQSMTLTEVSSGYGAALATYLHTLTGLAESAAAAVSDAASQSLLSTASEEDCTTTLVGAGGTIDKFADQMQKELDKGRKRAVRTTRKFLSKISRIGGNDFQGRRIGSGTFRIAPIVFEFGPAPHSGGSVAQSDRPLRLQMWLAFKVRNTGVVVTVSGTADPQLSGQFDVRLSRGGHEPVGDFMRNGGGVTVDGNGRWSVSDTLGAPAFDSGNRILLFGTEPEDIGVGPDPTRLLQVGVIGIR